MALLHAATLTPRKDELIEPWLRTRPWWDGADVRGPVAAFRLDDPAGEVGMEFFLMDSPAGEVLFVPVTYRAAPLPGEGPVLVGTMEHSVLGTRYVYDGCTDPVLVAAVLDAVRTGAHEADLVVRGADGTETVREPAASVQGDGVPTVARHDPAVVLPAVDTADRTVVTGPGWTLTVMRRPVSAPAPDGPALTGGFVHHPALRLAVVGVTAR